MRVALLEITAQRPECVNKDFMGGYGWAFHIGRSLPARMIELVKKKGEKVPILYFAYLAAIFRDHGHEVQLLTNEIPDADLVLMHASMIDYKNEIRWAQRIKEKRPNIKIGFLGPFATFRPNLFLPYADFLIAGEVEEAGLKLARGNNLQGVVISRPIDDLDTLPFPAWEYFPVKEYSYFPSLRETPFLVALSSRGCVYSCDYCPYPVNYQWRERNVEKVLDEIEVAANTFGAKALLFRDPLFSVNRKRARQIAEGIIQRGIKIKWACETRLDLLNEELIDIFYESGLRVINVGIESADEAILKKIGRAPVPVEHQERIVKFCDSIGLRVCAFYVLGLPEDSPEKIRSTVEYAKQLNTHAAMFYLATPFPGTAYYKMVGDGLLTDDYEKMDCFTPVVMHPQLSPAQLEALKEWAYVSYYYRPRWFFSLLRRIWKDYFPTQRNIRIEIPRPPEELIISS